MAPLMSQWSSEDIELVLTRRGPGSGGGDGDGGGGLFIRRGMSFGENLKLCENGGNILLVVMAGEARVVVVVVLVAPSLVVLW
jgi:hypothetical protein